VATSPVITVPHIVAKSSAGSISAPRRRKQPTDGNAGLATVPSLVWEGADYPRMEPGRYLVRGLKVQGPEWVRAFSRWSLRVEFATVHEPGGVSAFFNFGSDRLKQYIGRQSKYFHAWTIANGGPPRKGEQMSPEVFLDGQFFWVTVEDSKRKTDGSEKTNAEVYSTIANFILRSVRNQKSFNQESGITQSTNQPIK
jgi:hypothetical protein